MNRWRSERRRKVLSWAGAGTGAGVCVSVGAALIGVPVLGALGGAALAAGGLIKAFEIARAIPSMTSEHFREHLELREAVDRMRADARTQEDMTDQILDLIELDGVLRSHASAAVVRIRSMYERSAREGRIGMMDRIKGGLQAVTGADPISELEFMGRTIRSLLDREIVALEDAPPGPRDDDARAERQATISLLKVQRGAFESQVATLRRLNGTLRRVSESIRTMELQAASVESSRLDPMRHVVEQLAASLGADMEALERAMAELSAPRSRHRIDQL